MARRIRAAVARRRYPAPAVIRRHESIVLRRRGVLHGRFRAPDAARADLRERGFVAACVDRWAADEPQHLPEALEPHATRRKREVARTLAVFDELRRGASF